MASTYSDLKFQLMATGENSGTWGNVVNDNFSIAIEEAIAESTDVAISSGSDTTISLTNTNATQPARHFRLNLTGTSSGTDSCIVPAIEKPYLVTNAANAAVTVKVSGQTGVSVPSGKTMWLYINGTDVINAVTAVDSLTIDNITLNGNTISCATGSNLEIVPFAGQNIRLDGAIVIDAGVVTGATSITSTAFVGDITGDVTGNVSGTAATVTGAAQAAITSLGTLTTLTVDNITINGAAISSDTGAISFSDEDITTTGQVNAANFSSTSTTVGDDSVTSFTTVSGAILKIGVGGGAANARPNGFVKIEASETPFEIALERTTNIDFSTSALSGTTGTDGNVTISVNGTTCYIENRSGGTQVYDTTLFSR